MPAELLPPESSPDAASTPAPPSVARAIDALERALGGRDPLIAALVAVPPTSKLDYVVGLIADPRSDVRKLSALCKAGGITVGELLDAYKRGAIATAQVQAIKVVAEKLPEVVADLAARAVPHTVACVPCQGSGSVPAADDDKPPVPCKDCRGTGRKVREPDLATQQTVLDLAGLGRTSGPSVLIDQRRQSLSIGDHSPAAHSRLLQAVDQVLHRRGSSGTLRPAGAPVAPREGDDDAERDQRDGEPE